MTARATHPSAVCLTCDVPLAPDALFCGACGSPAPALPPAHAVAPPPAPSPPAPSLPAPVATRRSVGASSGTLTVSPGEVAPVGARLGALVLDQVVVVAVGAVVLAATDLLAPSSGAALAPLVAGAVMACVAVAQWVAEARTGLTIGNLLLGTRTVASATGRPAGLGRVLLRTVVQGLGSVVPVVGTYVVAGSGAWDASPAQRGWHDKAAGTMVLRRDASGREQTVLTAPTPSADRYAAPAPALAAVPAPASVPAAVPAPAAVSAPVPAPEPAPAPWPVSRSEPSRMPVATQVWLVFDTGESLAVVGDGAVGRHPQGAIDGAVAHAVAIDDPSRSISKLHLVFGPEPGGVWVMDRGSTNGTVVVAPDGEMRALPAGARAHVAPGWVVRFGERAFRVEAR
ncbi:RDD family protein [Cellulomonas sp. P22]|uniref:RDD family protein n=1 Tax=Cellulomonas sp. P22 TaxID=3373189 RepID=UPI0037939012